MDEKKEAAELRRSRADDFWDLILLNILFVLSSLPLVTFGAARCALYCAVSKLPDKRSFGGAALLYWRMLKCHFSRALRLWLILLAAVALISVDFVFAGEMPLLWKYCSYGLLAFVSLLLQAVITLGFPLLTQSGHGALELIRRAFALLAMHPAMTVFACLLQALPLLLALLCGRLFAALFLLWVTVYFSYAEFFISRSLGRHIRAAAGQKNIYHRGRSE